MNREEAQNLSTNHIAEIIRKNKIKTIPVNEITEKHNLFHDLGFDSLDSTELIMDLEKTLNIKIEDQKIDAVRTVEDVVTLILNEHHEQQREHIS